MTFDRPSAQPAGPESYGVGVEGEDEGVGVVGEGVGVVGEGVGDFDGVGAVVGGVVGWCVGGRWCVGACEGDEDEVDGGAVGVAEVVGEPVAVALASGAGTDDEKPVEGLPEMLDVVLTFTGVWVCLAPPPFPKITNATTAIATTAAAAPKAGSARRRRPPSLRPRGPSWLGNPSSPKSPARAAIARHASASDGSRTWSSTCERIPGGTKVSGSASKYCNGRASRT